MRGTCHGFEKLPLGEVEMVILWRIQSQFSEGSHVYLMRTFNISWTDATNAHGRMDRKARLIPSSGLPQRHQRQLLL